ncbi:inositol-tetrakisphosphate 1-kinase 3-like isoform X3 [Rhododendron vialii]|uniref:inositol-tetrakisphosphate 1-kinase 3-like isoform X3 n=1 Tax=Rhododendron vialii TaxID=182163 RepID=UPI00265DF3FF|nr:inositol-tetrakisphosphate 1-kinase 3-like isoform X3 [Rhododendron vialii]
MRLNGEISEDIDDDDDKEEREEPEAEELMKACSIGDGGLFTLTQNLVVGYALTSKKKQSFLQPKLLSLARNKGIFFVAIDRSRPLSDQGPFDVVLHKLSGKEWCQVVEDYRLKHPEVTVLDPPYSIQHVYNRQSMLEDVPGINLPECYGRVGVPRQLVITKDPLSVPDEVNKAGLKLPLEMLHQTMYFLWSHISTINSSSPCLLVGGVLFKVYIIGETIKVVRRFSLPDVFNPELSKIGVFRFPRVSSAAASAEDANLDPAVAACIAELPPTPLLERLAKELRHRLGLRLFNIDIIREHGTRDLYYVIDINYFPGFGKMPEYEHIFTDFLLSLMQSKYKERLAA